MNLIVLFIISMICFIIGNKLSEGYNIRKFGKRYIKRTISLKGKNQKYFIMCIDEYHNNIGHILDAKIIWKI